MRKLTTLLIVSALSLSACGSSNLNPVNWFGSSEPAPVQTEGSANPLIPEQTGMRALRRAEENIYLGTPIETITAISVERVPGGALIRADGVAGVQGVYGVQLTPANEDEVAEEGVLTYRLEGIRPEGNLAVGPAASRQVIAARRVTDDTLQGARTIRIEGLQNALVSRR